MILAVNSAKDTENLNKCNIYKLFTKSKSKECMH